jgi:hypothetical protein
MPLEWLWTSDALLPAVVANGAMRLNKTVVELLPDDHTILGYVLAEPAPFQPEMVDAALELIRCEPHHMYCPGMPGHLTDGQHLEVMYFVSKDGFWEPVQAQGLKPKFVSLKVFETLKIKFLETGINSWIT